MLFLHALLKPSGRLCLQSYIHCRSSWFQHLILSASIKITLDTFSIPVCVKLCAKLDRQGLVDDGGEEDPDNQTEAKEVDGVVPEEDGLGLEEAFGSK